MWMGTYPTLPSYALSTGANPQDVLNANKEQLIGKAVVDKFDAILPFFSRCFRRACRLSFISGLGIALDPLCCQGSFVSTSTRTKILPQASTSKTPRNLSTRTTTPRSQSHSQASSFSLSEIQTLLQLPPLYRLILDRQIHYNNEALKEVCNAILTASESTVRNMTNALLTLFDDVYGKNTHIPALLPRFQEHYTDTDKGKLVA